MRSRRLFHLWNHKPAVRNQTCHNFKDGWHIEILKMVVLTGLVNKDALDDSRSLDAIPVDQSRSAHWHAVSKRLGNCGTAFARPCFCCFRRLIIFGGLNSIRNMCIVSMILWNLVSWSQELTWFINPLCLAWKMGGKCCPYAFKHYLMSWRTVVLLHCTA